MTWVPVPGDPDTTVEALSDDDLDEVIEQADDGGEDFPESWAFSMACELKALRAEVAAMRPVVEAALQRINSAPGFARVSSEHDLYDAVTAYEAALAAAKREG